LDAFPFYLYSAAAAAAATTTAAVLDQPVANDPTLFFIRPDIPFISRL